MRKGIVALGLLLALSSVMAPASHAAPPKGKSKMAGKMTGKKTTKKLPPRDAKGRFMKKGSKMGKMDKMDKKGKM